MIRYLLHTSYLGTAYRGVTYIEQYYYFGNLETVQGVIEHVIKGLFRKRCVVQCSSRTDAKVHGLASTFQVDIPKEIAMNTDDMLVELNTKFKYLREAIQIHDIEIVDANKFEAWRNVAYRSYLYRIAVRKKKINQFPGVKQNQSVIPIEEIDRCHFIESDTFDIDRLKSVSRLFIGKHDFLTFMKYSKEEKTKSSDYTQRHLLSITVEPSEPCVTAYNLPMCELTYQFYDIHMKGRSFVYRQIRKMMAVMIAVAEGKLTERDVYEMLTIPSRQLWIDIGKQYSIKTAPAHALYFTGLVYKPNDEMTLEPIETNIRDLRMKSFFLIKPTIDK